jgi:hypothetical protein
MEGIDRIGLTLKETLLFRSIQSGKLDKELESLLPLLKKIYKSSLYSIQMKQYTRNILCMSSNLDDLRKEFLLIEKLDLAYTICPDEEKTLLI